MRHNLTNSRSASLISRAMLLWRRANPHHLHRHQRMHLITLFLNRNDEHGAFFKNLLTLQTINMPFLFKTSLTAAVLTLALVGCSTGINKPLMTNMEEATYKKTHEEAARNMDQRDFEAFDWAVSDLTIETANTRYPKLSPLQIIQKEIKEVLEKCTPNNC